MGPLIEGVILGLTLAMFFGFGPALFALLQTTIHRGFISGLMLAIGIFLSDFGAGWIVFCWSHTNHIQARK
jgi:threonine/homoserine/homoserine lactone efflux protein